jgi:tetratricopeptide (TPR) repeat protein
LLSNISPGPCFLPPPLPVLPGPLHTHCLLHHSPSRCKEAIDEGLAKFAAKDFQAAIDLFNLALELPGNGAYRIAGSPREYSCPSDAEENAALYNMACCYAQLQQRPAALACLEAILENGEEGDHVSGALHGRGVGLKAVSRSGGIGAAA